MAANVSLPWCFIFHCESFFVFGEINSNFLNNSFVAGLLVALTLLTLPRELEDDQIPQRFRLFPGNSFI